MTNEVSHTGRESPSHHRFQALLSDCYGRPPLPAAVIYPCDELSLHGALEATAAGLIDPVFFGPAERIRSVAEALGRPLDGIPIHPARDPRQATADAAAAALTGRVNMLIKGDIHTEEMMRVLLAPESHMRTGTRMSHAFAIDAPGYAHPLIVSDGALNVRPGLDEKKTICQNAIDLATAIGIQQRRLAVVAAAETVHATMPATTDAAALAKMAERGQITGAEVDGPLSLDLALSPAAVRAKHVDSRVAGRANVLVVPDLEAGNLLAKELVLLADGIAAGIVLGAAVPIALTSRSDGAAARVASAALGVLMHAQSTTNHQRA
jgi:phosphate acetyltransferase